MAHPGLPPLLGEAPAFLDLIDQVSRIAPLDRPVLVVGERGTGKELIATRLHFLSGRWDRSLVKLNAAALPATLLETELFGHEAGAFTGASRRRVGRFEEADGGTLFLDEIALASHTVQEQLLRVVEYGSFERLGSSTEIQTDVRLIAATNLDLPSEATAGRFRHDLLDRLAFDVLTLPPLRARIEDIIPLADHYGRRMASQLGWAAFPGFADPARQTLRQHRWPGNVRELRNVAERAVYRWPHIDKPVGQIDLDPFDSPFRPGPPAVAMSDDSTDFRASVAKLEHKLLKQALETTRHNQRDAAARLGLSYDQLRHALRRHHMLPRARRLVKPS